MDSHSCRKQRSNKTEYTNLIKNHRTKDEISGNCNSRLIKTGNETEEESNEMQEGKAMQNNNIKHKTKQEKSRIDK